MLAPVPTVYGVGDGPISGPSRAALTVKGSRRRPPWSIILCVRRLVSGGPRRARCGSPWPTGQGITTPLARRGPLRHGLRCCTRSPGPRATVPTLPYGTLLIGRPCGTIPNGTLYIEQYSVRYGTIRYLIYIEHLRAVRYLTVPYIYRLTSVLYGTLRYLINSIL